MSSAPVFLLEGVARVGQTSRRVTMSRGVQIQKMENYIHDASIDETVQDHVVFFWFHSQVSTYHGMSMSVHYTTKRDGEEIERQTVQRHQKETFSFKKKKKIMNKERVSL